nr:putative Ig domain-containing protein [Candidatus Sigynarchaeota archaeon]
MNGGRRLKNKKVLIPLISAIIITGILLPVGVILFLNTLEGNPTPYTQTLSLDGGARFTIISSQQLSCGVISNPTGYPAHYNLSLVQVNGSLDIGHTANITFYSPAGFGEHHHIGIVSNGAWDPIPATISLDGKNLSTTVDHTRLCNPSSVLSVYCYPELVILLEARREDNETIILTRNAINQIVSPLGMKNITYNITLQAQGGNGSYSWEIHSGSLPSGLNLADNGILSGNATAFGNFTFEFRVSSADYTKDELFNLTIADYIPNKLLPPNTILSVGFLGEPYVNETSGDPVIIQMGGGNSGPYSIYLKSGVLPTGTSFSFWNDDDYAYARINGYTNLAGTFNFTMAGNDEIYTNFETNDPYIGNYIEREYSILVSLT